MRNFLMSAALVAAVIIPNVASADDAGDRTQAIQICREQVVAQSGLTADAVRLDQVRVRPRAVRVDFDVWRDGALQNVRCDVDRHTPLSVASITPAVQTASATTTAAAQ